MTTQAHFDRRLIAKYDVAGPRYTSYPTSADFNDEFPPLALDETLHAQAGSAQPLSLYVHVPFCESLCFYCGCSKIVTKNTHRADEYLGYLNREIEHYAALVGADRQVRQLHWGGGTPTFLNADQISTLMGSLHRHFSFASDSQGEFSIEIDPRRVDAEMIDHLRFVGFNRLSMGVQDFDIDVQRAINRIQPFEMTASALEAGRNAGFKSINFDLIYGLPEQRVRTFEKTLKQVIALSPDRISLFNYAHMPHLIRSQRAINEESLPSIDEKLDLFDLSKAMFESAGYVSIGLDHFAKPHDPLAMALRQGQLHRNFQGYTTGIELDMLGLGMTSISKVGDVYAQNHKTLEDYYSAIAAKGAATARGHRLSSDDQIRAALISDLSCERTIQFDDFSRRFNIAFGDYFVRELAALADFVADGLVELTHQSLRVTEAGKLLLRPICMVFDSYRCGEKALRFSKVL